MKTFRELIPGDIVYLWSNDYQDCLFELEVTSIEIYEWGNIRIKFKETTYNGDIATFRGKSSEIYGNKLVVDKAYGAFDIGLKVATSKEEFFKRYGSFFNKKLREFEDNVKYHEREIKETKQKIERFNKLLKLNKD